MAENDSYQTPSSSSDSFPANAANDTAEPAGWHSPTQGGMTTPIAPEGGIFSYSGAMADNDSMPSNMNSDHTPDDGESNMDYNMEYEPSDAAPPEGRHMVHPGNVTWGCASCASSSPSVPGYPGLPVIPSMPSTPSMQSMPSMPSAPSMPS
ncbi:MAG: hypothetical protein Q4E86_14605, partial [Lachnospiraceae bacterium]|nr:hypothetical protein [Lachnospiraceae bacterium]